MKNVALLVLFIIAFPLKMFGQTSISVEEPILVKDITYGSKSTTFGQYASTSSLMFFIANDGEHGNELWRSDGRPEGTFMLKDLVIGAGSPNFTWDINSLVTSKKIFFAVANNGQINLWCSNGTPEGTVKLSTVDVTLNGIYSIDSYRPAILNDILYFNHNDGVHGNELWRSDGTIDGTYMVEDISPEIKPNGKPLNGGSNPVCLTTSNGSLFFGAIKSSLNLSGGTVITSISYLCRSNGTSGGTVTLKEASPLQIYNAGGFIYHTEIQQNPAPAKSATSKLWCDITGMGGSFLVDSVNSGIETIVHGHTPIAYTKDYLFFDIYQKGSSQYRKLWRSSHTVGGKVAVIDTSVSKYALFENQLYFGYKGSLWKTDNSKKGASIIKRGGVGPTFVEFNHFLYFNLNGQLWRTDSTVAGTTMVKNFNASNLIKVGSFLYFIVNSSSRSSELWKTNGTSEGTVFVKKFVAVDNLIDVDGTLFCQAEDANVGKELWRVGKIKKTISYTHTYQDNNNLELHYDKVLGENQPFKVCADGSDVSIFKIRGEGIDFSNYTLRLGENNINNDPAIVGKFFIQNSKSSEVLTVRYQHPTYIESESSSKLFTLYLIEKISNVERVVDSMPLIVYRAPVLMVHGLWSNSSSFATMANYLKESKLYPTEVNLLHVANYEDTHAQSFTSNVPVIRKIIETHLSYVISSGIAAGKVDYVAHSMGGILGRLYLQGDLYKSGFHKLITINTPHSGSQIANFILSDFYLTALCEFLVPPVVTGVSTDACLLGAIEDLKVDGIAINNSLNGKAYLNRRKVPSHAIATTINSTKIEQIDTEHPFIQAGKTLGLNLVMLFASQSIFQNQNDLIVSLNSQMGGLGACSTIIPNQQHTGSPANANVINKVRDLLVSNPLNSPFCQGGFFPPILNYNQDVNKPVTQNVQSVASVKITQPANATLVSTGSELSISVTGSNLVKIITVVDYKSDSILLAVNNSNLAINKLKVDEKWTGKKYVYAFGRTAQQSIVKDTLSFTVYRAVSLTSPTNLRISANLPKGITLAWNDLATNETGYEVERSSVGHSFERIAVLPANSISYTNSDLTEGISYTYRVRAINSLGSSNYSNAIVYIPLVLSVTSDYQAIIYPNPIAFSQTLTIDMKGSIITNLKLINTSGQLINEWIGKSLGQLNLPINDLSKGTYIVLIQTNDNRKIHKKLIVE